MSTINDGGPAFPCDGLVKPDGLIARSVGLSIRDYFAAKAMAAQMTAALSSTALSVQRAMEKAGVDELTVLFARNAYAQADAMLKARES